MRRLSLILALAGCARQPDLPKPATSDRAVAFPIIMLRLHNEERAFVSAAPLVWDAALEAGAASYARELAARGSLQHSSRAARPGQGENLWMGTRGAFSPAQMVAAWASEKRRFRPGVFPAVSATGNWADVGHYTQLIWRTTTRLGCAVASNASADFLVCRYGPAGNIDGRWVP